MSSSGIKWAVVFVALIGLAAASVQANIIIDNFNQGGSDMLVNNGSPTASDTDTGLAVTNTIGGERYSALAWEEGEENTTLQINQSGGSSERCSYGSQPANNGFFQLIYGNSSDLNADLSDASDTRFGIHFYFSDVYSTTTVTVVTSGGGSSSLSVQNPLGGAVDTWTYFDYASFSGTADFNNIDKITVTVACTPGADITFDEISTSAIPEPTVAALMLLVCGGAFHYRRRLKVQG